nr:MAG TPA: hypothetical protein [Caudoviricetes sp.]
MDEEIDFLKNSEKEILFISLQSYMKKYEFERELNECYNSDEFKKALGNDGKSIEEFLKGKTVFFDEKIPLMFNKIQKDIQNICSEIKEINENSYSKFIEKYDLKRKKLEDMVPIYEDLEKQYLNNKNIKIYEFPEVYLQKLTKIERELMIKEILKIDFKIQENYKKIRKEQESKLEIFKKYNEEIIKANTKDILGMMGIFLSIFSVIGIGITGILNIRDNLSSNILLIMGSLLIVITLLFSLIKFEKSRMLIFIFSVISGITMTLLGVYLHISTDKEKGEMKMEKVENR